MKLLTRQNLDNWVEALLGAQLRVIAPTMQAGQPVYAPVARPSAIELGQVIPRNSIKDFLFPQTETVMLYSIRKSSVEVKDVKPEGAAFPKTMILGARPCDAAGAAALRSVFTWQGDEDPLFLERCERTTVVTLACSRGDACCFCTSVGLAPDSREGSDLLLRETVGGNFGVEVVTDKGAAVLADWSQFFEEGAEPLRPVSPPPVIERSDVEKMLTWLSNPSHYGHEVWSEHAAKCLGCGACTYVCPTCHCFDLTDEGSAYEGERRKNWDACQFDHFTAHAGGHNPRPLQSQRWRNRFMCKFHFYPTKFSAKGCVGCGRCIRVCYVGLDIAEMMEKVTGIASSEQRVANSGKPDAIRC
jgi:ferredoxin